MKESPMNDANGNELAIGDTVDREGQQYIVDGFDGDLVVCKWPVAAESFKFPGDPPEQPPRYYVPDPVRVRFVADELVKA
jgi:hypothetical protein